ncbi:MAG: thioredoxin domain-containing protein [Acidobacteria bacterium]|nr:thioredoxin domain-containing protein [Acidobacteriota bacterium]
MPANRLIHEKSPYLLQHAHNPVDWYAWGPEAFEQSRVENKPIFLSIGYSTCHWCHVMERESFESDEIAEVLNRHFIPIKLDREERPDVDRIYMLFVQATTGSGGWPMSVWLTPELKPFYGGIYFPPTSRWGRLGAVPAFARFWLRSPRPGRTTASASSTRVIRCSPS